MSAYINKLQGIVPVFTVRGAFGWTELKSQVGEVVPAFVLGNRLLAKGRTTSTVGLSTELEDYASQCLEQQGTVEGWRKVPQFYERHNIIRGQLAIAAGFGSLLMAHAPGQARVGILNLHSPSSGSGKTTMQLAALSAFGKPDEQMLTRNDTNNSRLRVIGYRRHLPVAIDEVTNLKDEDLSETLFGLSSGREKKRLSEGGRGMVKAGTFNCTIIMSANNTVFDKMQDFARGREAEIKRVLEVYVPASEVPATEANEMMEAMRSNYGVAGEFFIKQLLDNDELLEFAKRSMAAYVNKYQPTPDERYWFNLMAATCTAAILTNKMGLTNFDVQAIHRLGMRSIEKLRAQLSSSKDATRGALSEFLSEHRRRTLVVASAKPTEMQKKAPAKLNDYVWSVGFDGLDVRIEADTGNAYIRKRLFDNWCSSQGLVANEVLQAYGGVDAVKTGKKRLGVGVKQLSYVKPAPCYLIKDNGNGGDGPKAFADDMRQGSESLQMTAPDGELERQLEALAAQAGIALDNPKE